MSLLFFKVKVNNHHVLWAALLLCNYLFANDSIPNNTFLEDCKKAEAYLLYSYTDVSYTKSWSGYKRHVSITNKLVVNNSAGVDKFAFLNLSEFISENLKEIKVKTLKANGSVVELDSSIVFQRKSKNDKIGPISYPIPGVEPGDTIITSYAYNQNIKSNELMDYVSLYSDVPSLSSEYTVRIKPELLLRYKAYNNFPEPQVISNDTLTYCVFKMERVKKLPENQNVCMACELPYLYYSIQEDKNEVRKWKDVYNQEFNAITQPVSLDNENASYYNRWKKAIIGEAKDSTKYYKLELLIKDINENVQMEPTRLHELIKSSGYFLKEKRLDPISIRRLYRQLLEDLEIEYSAVFAKSKRDGPIDPYYIRNGEYDHIFFAYNDAKNTPKLLYPNDEYFKYQINEIPTSIYNTEAVIAKPYLTDKIKRKDKFISADLQLAEADSVIVNVIKLPGNNSNYMKQIYYGQVDLEKKDIFFKCQFSISGGLSTDLRNFFSLVNQNKEVGELYDAIYEFEGDQFLIQIDTLLNTQLKNTPPFNYTVNAEGKLKEELTVNGNILSIPLENLLQHNEIDSDLDTIDLDYYLDYDYMDHFMIILNFPCEIEVLGFDESKANLRNDFGEYLFNLKMGSNNTQLTIESNYNIIRDFIPKNQYQQLKEVNEILKEVKNKRLLIKLNN